MTLAIVADPTMSRATRYTSRQMPIANGTMLAISRRDDMTMNRNVMERGFICL